MVSINRSIVLEEVLARLDGWGDTYPRAASPNQRTRSGVAVESLGISSNPMRTFKEVQSIRRSVHQFADCTISCSDTIEICSAAYGPELGIGVFLVARDVEGLAPGVYEFVDSQLKLVLSVDADSPLRQEWFLQREFAESPAVLILVSSIALCGNSLHAYRQMMTFAGEKCQDAALKAISIGLGGVVFAGLLMSGLVKMGIDGYNRTGIMGFAFGKPKDEIDVF